MGWNLTGQDITVELLARQFSINYNNSFIYLVRIHQDPDPLWGLILDPEIETYM